MFSAALNAASTEARWRPSSDLRSLITDLRPAALDEFGIESALEAHAERVSRQTDVGVDLEVDLDHDDEADSRYSPEIEATVYRIVQEAHQPAYAAATA